MLFLTGAVVTLFFVCLTVFPPSVCRIADSKVYDLLLRKLPQGPVSDLPVIVGIDNLSLKEYGQWPWPRYRLAQLINKIEDLGAVSIGLDIILSEPDRSSISVISRELAQQFQVTIQGVPPKYQDNDQILAETIGTVPVSLGFKFLFEPRKVAPKNTFLNPLRYAVQVKHASAKAHLLSATDVLGNLPSLSQAARASGFVNATPDPDGVLRRVPLVIEYRHQIYPSLALSCLMTALRKDHVSIKAGEDGLTLLWAGRKIALGRNGNLLVRFRGRQKTFPYFSAADILGDRLPEGIMGGKLAFVGSWAAGLGDRHVSPLDNSFPGPEVHANIVDNLLRGDILQRPIWAGGAELFGVLLIGVFISTSMALTGAAPNAILTGLSVGGIWHLFYWLFQAKGLYLSPVMPLSTALTNFGVLSFLKYVMVERYTRHRTRELLQAQDATIISLAALSETRDDDTGAHIRRTQHYVHVLAKRVRRHPEYHDQLDEETIDLLFKSAPLHDIGKVGIPDKILCKAGKLTQAEFDQMKMHTIIGGNVFNKAEKMLNHKKEMSYLRLARELAESHHEKWDGTGYPRGLKAGEIPLSGRLMALADTYDALITRRVYKPAFSHKKAKDIILKARGTQFDPIIVDAFLQEEQTFRRIAREFADSNG